MNVKVRIDAPPELKAFLPKYLENRKNDLRALRMNFESGDLAAVQILSHKIRGHALSYGFDRLSAICTSLEKAAIANDAKPMAALLDEYEDYISSVDIG